MEQQSCTAHEGESCQAKETGDRVLHDRMEHIGSKLLVLSGKGGVGKSTVAANLAIALARSGLRVGLLDVDVHGPSIPKLMGLEGQQIVGDSQAIFPVLGSLGVKVMSVGFLLPSENDAVIWRGPRKYGLIRQFLQQVAWGELDFLVIDAPPGTGDEPMAVAELARPRASAVLVTTPQELAVADVRRSVMFCHRVNLPVTGILENMSGLVCPGCGYQIDLFGSGGGESLAKAVGVPFLGRIPIDPAIVTCGDSGRPFAESEPTGPAAAAFADTVERILAADLLPDRQPPHRTRTTEEELMRIAIPLANGRLTEHFGHCQEFAIVDVDPQQGRILDTRTLEPPPHEPGVLPRWLGEQGATVIIAGGMGGRAREMFLSNGIEVILGAPAEPPQELVTSYLQGNLRGGANPCDHTHQEGGCQHHR